MIGDSSAFGRLAKQLEAERDAAMPIVAQLAAAPERHLDAPMPPSWRTVGMVRELSAAARAELSRSPQRSLYLAQLAAAIAGGLPESYPRVLRAQAEALAWKDVSNAHRYQSRHDAALRVLDLADRRIENEPALAHERALLALARAITYREINRFAEALALVNEAQQTFTDYDDHERVAQCELATGAIHYRAGDLIAARQAYMRVIAPARAADDLHTVAAAYNNLGRVATDAGDLNAAVDALQQARAIFRALDLPVDIARATWSIGVAQLSAGGVQSSIPILAGVRRDFIKLGMPEEAGLAGVDLIEAFLATDSRAHARELASVIAEEFRAANLNERALQALAYLRDTADVATPVAARHVGAYLRRLKEEPKLVFIAPPSER